MTNSVKTTAGETAKTIWDDTIDYSISSPDRPYKLRLENGVLLHLNLEQFKSMMEDVWREKRELYLAGRCMVSAERGGLKRCTKDCMNVDGNYTICHNFMNHRNGGVLSLDKLFEDNEFEIADYSYVDQTDVLAYEQRIMKFREEIELLEDEVDRRIMELLKKELSEREIARKLSEERDESWNQMKVNRRKNEIFNVLRSKLKDY